MTVQRVHLITLGVADLGRAREFYGALGWQEHQPGLDDVAFYQMHGAVLGLFDRAALAADQDRPHAQLGTGAITLAQNYSTIAEVDEAYRHALGCGAAGLKAPQTAEWGGYSGYWADLDGHVWEVAMNPWWHLADDGSLTLPD